MTFSIRRTIRELVAPDHRLTCPKSLWKQGIEELKKRGRGQRESGAFLLGTILGNTKRIERFIYYDDLEGGCLDTGAVVLNGSGYGPLWQLCRDTGLKVVADVHTHPAASRQSHLDKTNPMVAVPGHIALIVPNFASGSPMVNGLGIYEYKGAHQWHDYSGKAASRYFYIGIWG